ncbi:HK97 gp10 family phage protein [Pseudomonas abietaniphila]|uniref:HK97 gp10 family phage protein n=1 Tax=Pseudomonas abietaniphila TaxID=89065 RepID=UPI000AE95822|nr:HK97 gp10 family phage protein [Pseudomonas abietaniphila]
MAEKIHHMTSRYSGLNGSFAETLQQFRDQTLENMDEIFRKTVIQIGTSVIRLSPVDTGRFVGNWQFTIDQPASGTLENYDKEKHETIARFISEVQALTFGQTAYLVNNLPYAIPLEYQHSSQAPAGMVGITLELFDQFVREAVREVTQ